MPLVYVATNKINGKKYVGIVTSNSRTIGARKASHFHDVKRNSQCVFHRAIRKYGKENFEWIILKDNITKEEAITLEKYYINLYNTCILTKDCRGYNSTFGGETGPSDYKAGPRSEATKEKLRIANKGNIPSLAVREAALLKNKGSKQDSERRAKSLDALKKAKSMITPESRKKTAKKLSQRVRCIELNKEWPSAKEASEEVGISRTYISQLVLGHKKPTEFSKTWIKVRESN